MYVHDYRWSIGCTPPELNVIRKALAFASDENAPELTEEEATQADKLSKIIGGVYAAKRAEREERDAQAGRPRRRNYSQEQTGQTVEV